MKSIKLSTPVSLPKNDVSVTHEQPILLIGSCFTQNIGEKLADHKFNITLNPNGIIYNPISVIKSLKRVLNNEPYITEELTEFNGKWISFNHHGSFSSFNKNECLQQINTSLTEAHKQLKNTKTIFITFGSAWVYEYVDVGIVANCHKIPTKQFSKRLLSVKEILTAFDEIKEALKGFNMVFTVSPVRHVKDGLHENNLSKSTLLLAINNLVAQNENCYYFPAYELVIDELRDYRFYKDDLVHPTNLTVDYVWQKFAETYFTDETKELNEQINKIVSAASHKPFNFESEQHKEFIVKQVQLIDKLTAQYPFLNFEEEKIRLQGD